MDSFFRITQRHYDIIIQQAKTNFPQECGGFIGGHGQVIKGILPTFNQHLYDKTDTYAVTSQDVERAHGFFRRHKLDYLGMYHTHPKAPAIPSRQDLNHVQKYLFIISLQFFDKPDFAVYEIVGGSPVRLPLMIDQEGTYEVLDIFNPNKPASTQESAVSLPKTSTTSTILNAPTPNHAIDPTRNKDILQEVRELDSMVNDIASERKIQYPKFRNKGPGTDNFSTLA